MSELLGKVTAIIPSSKPIIDEYPVTFRVEDFEFTADATCTAGEWTRIGAYTVEAGMEYCMGRRFDGFIYILCKDAADSEWHGRIRFVVTNPAETKRIVVAEFGTRTMGSASDKTMKPVFPLSPPWVTQDSKIILEIYPESVTDIVLDYGNTLSAIDLTSRVAK